MAKPHNLLVALDLKKQGYQVWAVGGTTGDNPAWPARFSSGRRCRWAISSIALAEFKRRNPPGLPELRTTARWIGSSSWRCVEEHCRSSMTASAAWPGLRLRCADGILVCPTSAGAVVAVDLATRTLRWGYQYAALGPATARGSVDRASPRPRKPRTPQGHWLDATATIADGCVVLTPRRIAGAALPGPAHRQGPLAGPAARRHAAVACVHKGKIILVGKNA